MENNRFETSSSPLFASKLGVTHSKCATIGYFNNVSSSSFVFSVIQGKTCYPKSLFEDSAISTLPLPICQISPTAMNSQHTLSSSLTIYISNLAFSICTILTLRCFEQHSLVTEVSLGIINIDNTPCGFAFFNFH